MSRIKPTFDALKAANKTALVSFVMGGDPDVRTTAEILLALTEAGTDIIEIGMPFSDPMADGPTIQAAGLRALDAGTKLHDIFDLVANFRKVDKKTPIVLMGYANSVYSHGAEYFVEQAVAAGVDGLIVVDLPPEEAEQLSIRLSAHDVALIRLVAPTTKGERLKQLLGTCSGFVYYVSITGITGSKTADISAIQPHIDEIKTLSALPVCVGFGIKTADDVKQFADVADGVVVGSSIVTVAHESNAPAQAVKDFVTELKSALT